MAEFPSLPLFTDAYIGDTQHLSLEEHGAYLKLLMIAWRSSNCALPDNDQRLALMLGVTGKRWAKIRPAVMAFWTLTDAGWIQHRLMFERQRVAKMMEQKSDAGKASARSKYRKSLEPKSTAVATAEQRDANNQTHSHTQKEEKKTPPTPRKRGAGSAKDEEAVASLSEVIPAELAAEYVAHRRAKRAPLTPQAITMLARKLRAMPNPARAVEHSIAQGWTGVFPPGKDAAPSKAAALAPPASRPEAPPTPGEPENGDVRQDAEHGWQVWNAIRRQWETDHARNARFRLKQAQEAA